MYCDLLLHFVLLVLTNKEIVFYNNDSFVRELGRRLQVKSGDPQSRNHLRQRLAVAMQRGNAASVLGTMRSDEIWWGQSLLLSVTTHAHTHVRVQTWQIMYMRATILLYSYLYVSGFEKRYHFTLCIKCHNGRKHTSYADAHQAYFCTLSKRISGTGAAIEAQQSATESSSSVRLHSTTSQVRAIYKVSLWAKTRKLRKCTPSAILYLERAYLCIESS